MTLRKFVSTVLAEVSLRSRSDLEPQMHADRSGRVGLAPPIPSKLFRLTRARIRRYNPVVRDVFDVSGSAATTVTPERTPGAIKGRLNWREKNGRG